MEACPLPVRLPSGCLGHEKAGFRNLDRSSPCPSLCPIHTCSDYPRSSAFVAHFWGPGESVHLGVYIQNNCNFARGRDQAQPRSDTRRSDMSLRRFSWTEFSPRVVSEGPLLADSARSTAKSGDSNRCTAVIDKAPANVGKGSRAVVWLSPLKVGSQPEAGSRVPTSTLQRLLLLMAAS